MDKASLKETQTMLRELAGIHVDARKDGLRAVEGSRVDTVLVRCGYGHVHANQEKALACETASGSLTKWIPEMNESLVRWFERPKTTTKQKLVSVQADGKEVYEEKEVVSELPTFAGWAHSQGLTEAMVSIWAREENADKYPGFINAYNKAKDLQKDYLVQQGLLGRYNTPFAIFTAKNITDMRDVRENVVKTIDINKLLEGSDLPEDEPETVYMENEAKEDEDNV
jgi:hypothetical protein